MTHDPIDQTRSATSILIVLPVLQGKHARLGLRSAAAQMEEAIGLAKAIALDVKKTFIVPLHAPSPSTLLGKGKVQEIANAAREHETGLVYVDFALSPVQQRNLEKDFNAKVIDRTGLILEIFGERAQTKEGSLQVELAHLTYQKSRLVRSWTHLERQRGGFGFLGGPGETQIETDRRLIQERITRLKKELEHVKQTRDLQRDNRKRTPFPTVALVGYTNAGKSTLFNRLTDSNVEARDLLFATLDPTLRRIKLPRGNEIILSDTVGFIADLPTQLVSAFRATLEEVLAAHLILHVRDIAHEDSDIQAGDVYETLKALGIEKDGSIPILEIWNKSDLLDEEQQQVMQNALARFDDKDRPLLVSALTGEGCESLLDTVSQKLSGNKHTLTIDVPMSDGAGLTWLYQNGEVLSRTDHDDMLQLEVLFPEKQAGQARKRFGLS